MSTTNHPLPTTHSADCQMDYLKFFALALHSSIKEVRSNLDNKVLAIEVLDGIDLLTENLRKRFGFPSPPLNQPIASLRPERPSLQLRLETAEEAA